MRRSFRLHQALALTAVLVQACGTATASPSPTAPSPTTSRVPAASVASSSPLPAETAPPASPSEPTLPGDPYSDMPISLEMTADCGLCGPERWLLEPRFRLYADGTVVFRGPGADPETAPYRFVKLGDSAVEDLIKHALDDAGLRGATRRYPGNADDAGSFMFALHARYLDEAADVDVDITPLVGDGESDTEGNPIEDLDRYKRLTAFAALLSDFDGWLAGHAASSQPFVPQSYAAAIVERHSDVGEAPQPWPWADLAPEAFASAGSGVAVARISPTEGAEAGVGIGGGTLGSRSVGDGLTATVLVRPVLPGDDRPGAFGLRPDVVAIAVESELRVRSRSEVSDASLKLLPLLRTGDALYVISGPVAGSGYDWYEVHAPRTGLTGWVAAASKAGEDWIRPVPLSCTLGASPDPIVEAVGYELMHLACYQGIEFGGTRFLGHPQDDSLRCPDVLDWWHEPDWLGNALVCSYEFRPEEADTGLYDLVSGGVLHPSIANLPETLLKTRPGGLLVEVSGRLDHPDARECTGTVGKNAPAPALVRLQCRRIFVITEMRPAD